MISNGQFINISPIAVCEEYDRTNIHRHDSYELIWFTDVGNEDAIQIDFCDYPISANCFFFVASGQLHRMDRSGKEGWVISLSKDFFHSIVPINTYPRSTFAINSIINQQKCNMCRSLIDMILTEYRGDCRFSLMEAYFKALFIHLGPIFDSNPCCGNKKKAANLLDIIEDNFLLHRNVAFYAQMISLSEKAANDLSKKVLGKTIKVLLQERLILEIKREIATDGLSFKELSYKLGFNEMSYFCRFFKKETGYTLEEYKLYFETLLEE